MNTLSKTEMMALRAIRNSIVHEGRAPSVRELMTALGYKSPRSASIVIDSLISKKLLRKKDDGTLLFLNKFSANDRQTQTVNIPLVGTVTCGLPVLAEENIEAMIPVSVELARPSYRYFLLRASGDSMNRAGIEDGNLLLIRQQPNAQNGDIVVACIDGETAVKEFCKNEEVVILKPRSTNAAHQPIILNSNFLIQGIVIKIIPRL